MCKLARKTFVRIKLIHKYFKYKIEKTQSLSKYFSRFNLLSLVTVSQQMWWSMHIIPAFRREVEAGGCEVQSHPGLHVKFDPGQPGLHEILSQKIN